MFFTIYPLPSCFTLLRGYEITKFAALNFCKKFQQYLNIFLHKAFFVLQRLDRFIWSNVIAIKEGVKEMKKLILLLIIIVSGLSITCYVEEDVTVYTIPEDKIGDVDRGNRWILHQNL